MSRPALLAGTLRHPMSRPLPMRLTIPAMKHLHLVIGGLGAEPSPDLPTLAKLIARARPGNVPDAPGLSAALAGLFGVEARDLPAIALAAEGGEPGADAWFRADPVHLLAGMHSLTLFDCHQDGLSADQAAGLVAALNRHFEGGIAFLAPQPARWYARFRHTPVVDLPPLDQVAGGSVTLDLIGGPDARAVQRAGMEIQMLLHDHPVNVAREARNEATVNGVWLWGGGTFRRPVPAFDRVLADDFLARALAQAAGVEALPLPEALGDLPAGRTLAVLAPERGPERNWFAPALRALQRGRLDELELTLIGRPNRRHRLGRLDALRFWRR